MTHQLMLPFVVTSNDAEALTQEKLRLAMSVRAPRTLAGYESDWKDFESWARFHGVPSLPATQETVALYLTDLLNRPRRITTATRHLTAIAHFHRQAGFPSPSGKETQMILTGAQRIRCEQPQQKAPISVEQLRAMMALFRGDDLISTRDRAILLFGFATALRRSNIVTTLLADINFVEQGFIVHVRREKQDQRGRGRLIGVPAGTNPTTCPVSALRTWIQCRGAAPGPVFINTHQRALHGLHPNYVAKIVKRAITQMGLDPKTYAAHSLRAGFVTEAFASGASEFVVASQTGHRSLACLRRYFRPRDPFKVNACTGLGL